MQITKEIKFFSGCALLLTVLHFLWPSLGIDSITITLLIIASIPWLVPFLRSIELPGVVRIELNDAIRATESIPESTSEDEESIEEIDVVKDLSRIAENNTNLAIIGFRVEIEKKLYHAAEINSISIRGQSLGSVVDTLSRSGVLPKDLARDLWEIIKLGNKAAHGVPVSKEAAQYILRKAPTILARIDAHFRL